ncbi:heme-binding protein [Pseudomonas gingeri]|uniref:Heme-binding protein n=1 Tax=Pseudomonas gingeri TaxID=117681 RepID=A0A7Y7YIH7_9PSED|nr:heme-binding protein [Pseudomonas gingeri]NWB31420.1 heme-binding protein [Pseudomonas gingeri]NWC35715.1 heme-binding protein [Pseudomonas gingeri]NWD49434.1 heme-binding protein [Pseudomonas gingeri]NWE26442.1 heme-binding protein [Pseudomonas gingeri]NWE97429.1 heme-binding protein [Pseudomonas gingeri]
MKSKAILSQLEINQILNAARAEAHNNQWAVTIAIVDDGGHPLALDRFDGCAAISAYIAVEKARTSALGRRESKGYEDMVNGGRHAFLSAPLLTSLEGGVPIFVDGHVIGAVGVSGVKAEQDAQVARAGAQCVS